MDMVIRPEEVEQAVFRPPFLGPIPDWVEQRIPEEGCSIILVGLKAVTAHLQTSDCLAETAYVWMQD